MTKTELLIISLWTLLTRYQNGLEASLKGSNLAFIAIEETNYKFHEINLNRGGSCIETPRWIKNKGVTMTPKNKDTKCRY